MCLTTRGKIIGKLRTLWSKARRYFWLKFKYGPKIHNLNPEIGSLSPINAVQGCRSLSLWFKFAYSVQFRDVHVFIEHMLWIIPWELLMRVGTRNHLRWEQMLIPNSSNQDNCIHLTNLISSDFHFPRSGEVCSINQLSTHIESHPHSL